VHKIDFDKINKIHFIGIGGIGLSAIARLMKERGKDVNGSDLSRSLVVEGLEKIGIKIHIGQSEKNIDKNVDLTIHTTAVSKENPELKKARELGIKTITYPESLGIIFNNKFGVAVCGTHGKSSTAAMAGLLLDDAKLDPSIIVGSIVPRYKSNLRVGRSKYFLIEACEYERAFLNYYPQIIILNNIELDHTDYYKDIKDFRSAFKEFIEHLQNDGILIMNGDDKEIKNLKIKNQNDNVKFKNINIINFGLNKGNSVEGYDIKIEAGKMKFKVKYKGKDLGEFILKVPGMFNIYNSLGVISLGLVLDIPIEIIKKSLENYSGIWRRFEIKGKYKKALIISDYAHHPTAVKSTIEAAKEFYPNKRIFAVFQPHQHNRTKKLYKDFLNSFDSADVIILSEIFDVAGREEEKDQNVSSLSLANDIKKRNKDFRSKMFYAKDLEETRKLIDEKIKTDDILLVMGAGDIYKVADEMASKLKIKS
jgi:UDP-N-acetylmuramate--alanine ligase